MSLAKDIKDIEKRLEKRGIPLSDLFLLAGISDSTFYRWKAGNRKPMRSTWEKVLKAADKLAPV